MMEFFPLLLFFVYLWGFGFSFTLFVKESTNFLERNLMRLGVGLGIIPLLGILLNLFRIPLDWRIFLFLAIIGPVSYFLFNLKKLHFGFNIKINKSNIFILFALVLFLFTLFMYHKGAFSYPYLEDDDPWEHASAVTYISAEKTLLDSKNIVPYLDPYPPGYDFLLSLLYQVSNSLQWVLKFFNLLIISLGILFFYFFAKEFIGSQKKALFATFVLAAIPCYQSHFIWAHSLAVTLFFPSMYCLEMIKKDKKWMYVALFVISGILLTHPTESIKMGIMFFIYFVVKSFYIRKVDLNILFAELGAFLVSLVWWAGRFLGYLQVRFASVSSRADFLAAKGIKVGVSQDQNIISKAFSVLKTIFPASAGTGTRPYTFSDFFIAKKQNMINNPIGVGIVLSLLILFFIFYAVITYRRFKKDKQAWVVISLLWFLLTFLLVNSMTFNLPIGIFAFRVWMLMAIPIALLSAESAWILAAFFRQLRIPRFIVLSVLIVGIILTSGVQRYAVNTVQWPPGGRWTSSEELQAYVWLKGLPVKTKVFTFADQPLVIGMDKFSCYWCDDVMAFNGDYSNMTFNEFSEFLRRNKYEYFIVDGMGHRRAAYYSDENTTNEFFSRLMQNISNSGSFSVAYQNSGAVIFKVI